MWETNPEAFAALVEERARVDGADGSTLSGQLQASDDRIPLWINPVHSRLNQSIASCSAPYGAKQALLLQSYQYGGHVPAQQVDILDLDSLPAQVIQPELDNFPVDTQLLVYSRTGRFSSQHHQRIMDLLHTEVFHVHFDVEQEEALWKFAWGANSSLMQDRIIIHRANTSVSAMTTQYTSTSFTLSSPFVTGELGNLWWSSTFSRSDRPIVVVCGDSAEDFTYSYTRGRLTDRTLWFPIGTGSEKSLRQRMSKVLAEVLAEIVEFPMKCVEFFLRRRVSSATK